MYFNKIIDYIRQLFTKNNYQPNIRKIISNIEPGDFLKCTMPLSKRKLKKVPTGHQSRPYLVAYKSFGCFYGYYCTTKPYNGNCPFNHHERLIYINNEKKISNIRLDKLYRIPFNNIICTNGILDETDKSIINKKIEVMHIHRNGKKVVLTNLKLPLIGDVIKYKKELYYIDDIRNKHLYLLKASLKPISNHAYIIIENKKYYLSKNKTIINVNDKYSFYYITSNKYMIKNRKTKH